jgi:antitoxin component YwqK of YwqJK toxin-antitoxin module
MEVITYFTDEELNSDDKGKKIIKSKVFTNNEKKEGIQITYDEYGNILSELVYCDDKLVDGEHVIKDKYGTIIKFNTINNKLNGEYVVLCNNIFDDQVIKIKCTYKNNRMSGEYIYYDNEEILAFRSNSNYEDGKLHGNYQERGWSNMVDFDCFYKYDFLDGIFIKFGILWASKCEKICFYKLGELDGKCKDFHENGYLSKISFYKNGKLDGECKEFNCKGILIKKSFYNNGELVNEITNFNINELQLELQKFNNMVCNRFNFIRCIKRLNGFIRCKNNNITNPVNYCIFKFLQNIKYKNIDSIKEKFNILY